MYPQKGLHFPAPLQVDIAMCWSVKLKQKCCKEWGQDTVRVAMGKLRSEEQWENP